MISDFGLSKTEEDDSMMATACGTPGYVGRVIEIKLLQKMTSKHCILYLEGMFMTSVKQILSISNVYKPAHTQTLVCHINFMLDGTLCQKNMSISLYSTDEGISKCSDSTASLQIY